MNIQPLDGNFYPPRRTGLVLHSIAVVLFALGAAVSLWQATLQQSGPYFMLLLLLALLMIVPLGLSIYRGLALMQARYLLERNGLRLRWGLRAEDIPLNLVEWVRPASDLGYHLPLPPLPVPGAILGIRNVEGLGPVEFMAAQVDTMLLVATPDRIFAISPENPANFMRVFQRTIELGSISPIPAHTALPAVLFQRIWADLPARISLLLGASLTVLLFVVVSLLIPTRATVSIGFDHTGTRFDTGPSEWLLLLPVLATFATVIDFSLGLFFYRRASNQMVAYLMWASSAVTPALLLVATIFLIR